MKPRVSVRVVLFVLVLNAAGTVAAAEEAIELFNGKDLTGWTVRGGAAKYAVEDGAIVGRSAPNTINTFLVTDKDYGDFVLELDFKVDPDNFNSGVQIRSHRRREGEFDRVYGYQVEMDTEPERAWTGGIYFEAGSKKDDGTWLRPAGWLNDLSKNPDAQKARRLGEWNHLKVKAEGQRIRTWLNGVPAADYTDDDAEAFSPSGFIGLQVHSVGDSNDTKEVRWKNIRLTELE